MEKERMLRRIRGEKIIVGLCAGRHSMPVDEFIFPGEVNPTDFDGMYETASQWVLPRFTIDSAPEYIDNGWYDASVHSSDTTLVVYATGLTAALCAVLSVCASYGIPVTVMHYDRDTGEYVPQHVLAKAACAWAD